MTQTKAPASVTGASVSAGGPTAIGGHTQGTAEVKLPPGLFMTADHRYYFNGIGPYPSVTTVLDVMSKPALITWKAKEAAKAMYRGWLQAMEPVTLGPQQMPKDEDNAVLWSLKEADKARDTAASIGTGVHLLADMASRGSESQSEGFQVGSDTQPYLEAFRGFLGCYSASNIVSSEKAILNLNGYAGTYDLLMLIDDELWLLDIKTSKGYYPEYGLQLAAYGHGDYIILPNDPKTYAMPKVHRYGILHLRPDQYKEGWRLIEYPVTERDYIAFLGALEVYQWREEKRFSKQKLIGT